MTMEQGSVQVQTKSDRKSTMSAAAEVLDVRRKAAALVDKRFWQTRSMMRAYEDIGAAVGASGSWLRKFIKGYDEVKEPGLTVGFNIKAYYARVCGAIEADAERREHAAAESNRPLDQGLVE